MNPYVAVTQYLITSGTDLFDLVGTRVFFPHLPIIETGTSTPKQLFTNEEPGILMQPLGVGGAKRFRADFIAPQFICYGGQTVKGSEKIRLYSTAEAVFDALRELMRSTNNVTVAEAVVGSAKLTGGPNLLEDEHPWPTVAAVFDMKIYAK